MADSRAASCACCFNLLLAVTLLALAPAHSAVSGFACAEADFVPWWCVYWCIEAPRRIGFSRVAPGAYHGVRRHPVRPAPLAYTILAIAGIVRHRACAWCVTPQCCT